jgi:hypothetical protein
MNANESRSAVTKPGRLWPRYCFVAGLMLVLFTGIGTIWGAARMQEAKRQEAAVEAILRAGGEIKYDYNYDEMGKAQDAGPPAPAWLRRLAGDDFFTTVVYVSFFNGVKTRFDDSELKCLDGLSGLRRLDLRDTQVTDAGLEQLAVHTHLQMLELGGSQVTKQGVAVFQKKVPKCRIFR